MTCYGAGSANRPDLRLEIEIKGVNHRFLDTQLRIPREYLPLEPKILTLLKSRFNRGRVEIFLRQERQGATGRLKIDETLAAAYRDGFAALGDSLGVPGAVDINTLIGQPGVVTQVEAKGDADADWPLLKAALEVAMEAALGMRVREGEALYGDLKSRFQAIDGLRNAIAEAVEGEVEGHRNKLFEKVQAVLKKVEAKDIDDGRLLQEVTYLCDRSDITEELTRLESHLAQALVLIDKEGAIGREIEFLVQEVLREANTIASKATTGAVKHHALHIKVEVEKIREQVQNIE